MQITSQTTCVLTSLQVSKHFCSIFTLNKIINFAFFLFSSRELRISIFYYGNIAKRQKLTKVFHRKLFTHFNSLLLLRNVSCVFLSSMSNYKSYSHYYFKENGSDLKFKRYTNDYCAQRRTKKIFQWSWFSSSNICRNEKCKNKFPLLRQIKIFT